MGRVIFLGAYIAMIVGGILTLNSAIAVFTSFAAGGSAIAILGAYLLWEDFLR